MCQHWYASQLPRAHLARVSLPKRAWRENEEFLPDQPQLARGSFRLPAQSTSAAGRHCVCLSLHTLHLQRAVSGKRTNGNKDVSFQSITFKRVIILKADPARTYVANMEIGWTRTFLWRPKADVHETPCFYLSHSPYVQHARETYTAAVIDRSSCTTKPIKRSLRDPQTCRRPGPGVFKGDAVGMGVLRERERERKKQGRVMFHSSAVLSSHLSPLTRQGCMLLLLNCPLLLDAFSGHLKSFRLMRRVSFSTHSCRSLRWEPKDLSANTESRLDESVN